MKLPFFRTPERREALLTAAENWIGTPFVGGQAIRGGGVDCARLADAVAADAGWPAYSIWPEYTVSAGPNGGDARLLAHFRDSGNFDLIDNDLFMTGDVLLFAFYGGDPYHTGLVTQPPQFIHVMCRLRVTRAQFDDPVFKRVFHSAWRPMESVA